MTGKYPLNGTHYTEADDLEMLSHPEDWGPLLFVKRGHPAHEVGVVRQVGAGGVGRLIYFTVERVELLMVLLERPPMHYESAEAMVADGWRVD